MKQLPYKIGINVIPGLGVPELCCMDIIKEAGFDSFFNEWSDGKDVGAFAKRAKELDLIYQSVHAPFGGIDCMWKEGERGNDFADMLCRCADDCEKFGIPIMIVHPFIGFFEHEPNDLGVSRFLKVVDHAEKRGIVIAFENVEGEEYLEAIMKATSSPSAKFCLDTGHEVCYNRSRDRLALYGDRLAATHFNDNLGIRTTDGSITPADDLHLVPFDGVVDWQNVMDRIKAHDYNGIITFELKVKGGEEHKNYQNLTPAEYYKLAYERAVRVVTL